MYSSDLFVDHQPQYKPYNMVTGQFYKGSNIITLTLAAQNLNGLNDGRWLTFLQAKQLGYKIKKGSKGTKIDFWKIANTQKNAADDPDETITDEGNNSQPRPLRTHKVFTVFHASQVEGIPPCIA